MSTTTTTLIVAGLSLVGTLITAVASVVAVLVSRENRRKLTTPGEETGTIGQQVGELNS